MTAREQALKLLAENPRFVLVEQPGCGHLILGAKDRIAPPEAALFGDRFAKKDVALRLALRSVDAGRSSGRG
jgi:hypothetical protein